MNIKLEYVRIVQDNYSKKKLSNKKHIKWWSYIPFIIMFIIILSLGFAQAEHNKSILYYDKDTRVLAKTKEESNIIDEPEVQITIKNEEITGVTSVSQAGISDKFDGLNDTIDLIARTVIAEVGYDCEYCQKMVIDTILNRVDDQRFSNTVKGVILDNVAFETVKNKEIWKVTPTDKVRKLVWQELTNRTNNNVLAFKESEFHTFGYAISYCHNAYFSGM